jgi:hypothetical protein
MRRVEGPGGSRFRLRLATAAVLGLGLARPAAGQAAGAGLDAIRMGRFDYGKMWTFEYAPEEYFRETYGFDANHAWFERARLSALRIPGCSSSFVSPNGLMVTNHHCIRGRLSGVARPGETLLDSGFVARSVAEERPIPGYYADQLIAIEDVSTEVLAAVDSAGTEAARAEARRAALERIERRLRAAHADLGDAVRIQIVPLYNGGRYSAYVFRRFTDIRLVAAVELQMGFFGGDPDNFTYPRYALDFGFLRVYENGQPYHTDHYFGWGRDGVEEGDVVFVIGNPGPTNRLATVSQLEFQRDVSVPAAVDFLDARLKAMRDFIAASPAEAERLDLRNRAFGLSNSLKASAGRLAALRDPVILARKADAERQLQDSLAAQPDLARRYGTLFTRLAAVQERKGRWAREMGAFWNLTARSAPTPFEQRVMAAMEYQAAVTGGAAPGDVEAARTRVLEAQDFPPALEQRLLALRFADFARYLGPEDSVTRAALGGRTPDEAARFMMQMSAAGSRERTRQALEAGQPPPDDAALPLVAALFPRYRAFQQAMSAIQSEEQELAAELGRARFEVYGRSVPPDASSSPRITDGVVRSYEYNGTLAPPYTTFFGMYSLFSAHGPGTDWDLPYRWRTPPAGLPLSTPLNFISTADTYGGNSGSPAVTRSLALVGLNFDRNIEGLSRDFIYLPERGRNIMVDARAIQAALDHVYDADRIVQEVLTGRLFRTEAEADAAGR